MNNFEAVTNKPVFWFRRDLRLDDNKALHEILKIQSEVQPIFIFDTQILGDLENKYDPRVSFIHDTLRDLQSQLRKLGSTLEVFYGDPVDLFEKLNPAVIYANEDYDPYSRNRDEQVSAIQINKNSRLELFKDHVIFAKNEVVKSDGNPYTVFTPYKRVWLEQFANLDLSGASLRKSNFQNLVQRGPSEIPELEEIGFRRATVDLPPPYVNFNESVIRHYDETRDYPGKMGTSRLSVHFRFGTVSIRQAADLGSRLNKTWLNELIWRDFYNSILWHFPEVVDNSFRRKYDAIEWRNEPDQFDAWCTGKTGYPMVDAGMRELNTTGYMHNRVRMITASFLVKHLLVDWRWGESYFAEKLLDYDLASNNGGWQWAAGSGTDAAPYFRIFNPSSQQKKFDPKETYIQKWIEEWGTADYPQPIVDHKMARQRALDTYKRALSS